MRAPNGATASVLALIAVVVVVISTGWAPQSRITIVSAGPYLFLLTLFYLLAKRRDIEK
jgi:L-asparagine transporter-like permease